MSFPKLQTPDKKRLILEKFSQGINPLAEKPYNCVKYAENTVFTGESIKTRPGIRNTENIISTVDITRANEFILTDAEIFINGIYHRLCVQFVALGSYKYRYIFKLLSENGDFRDAGIIEYAMDKNDIIYMPNSIICFSASRIKGSGIFAFINLQVSSDEDYRLEIFELNSEFSSWIKYAREDMYIPNYMVGGRGNYSHKFEADLPEPEYLEPLNMLNGICSCSYTTDGYSNCFHIPIFPLQTDGGVYMTAQLLLNNNTKLNFAFPKDTYVSNSVNYGDYKIYLTYNGGFLQFNSEPSGFIPDKVYGVDNNLKVTFMHETVKDFNIKAFMKIGGWYNISQNGSQGVLTGNYKHPNLTLASYPNNPLYFPKDNCISCGSDNKNTVALVPFNNKVFNFKEDSVYSLESNSSKFIAKQISHNIGCKLGRTVKGTQNAIIFFGTDNKVYALKKNGNIVEISKPIKEYIPEISDTNQIFAIASHNEYILFFGNKALCLDLGLSDSNLEKPVWNIWNFPEKMSIAAAMKSGDKLTLIASAQTGNNKNYYIAALTGTDEDEYYSNDFPVLINFSAPINVKIETAKYRFSDKYCRKVLTEALFYGNSENGFLASFKDEKGDILKRSFINISCEASGKRSAKIYPLINFYECGIELTTSGAAELVAMQLEYYNLT